MFPAGTTGVHEPAGSTETSGSATRTATAQEARTLLEQGRYEEAARVARLAAAEAEDTRGADSIEVADALCVLSEALRKDGKGEEAETREAIDRALRIQRKRLPPYDLRIAASLNALGILLKDATDYAGARSAHEEALRIREKVLGKDHPDVAASLSNLGNVLMAMGDLNGARPHYERSLEIQRSAFGDHDLRVARSLNRMAIFLRTMGDTLGSIPLYEEALAITEEQRGRDHPDVAGILSGLAAALERAGDFRGAKERYERALAIRREHLDPRNPLIAHVMHNLAFALLYVGEYADARKLLEEAYGILRAAGRAEHPDAASVLQTMGRLRFLMGDFEAAEEHYTRAMGIWVAKDPNGYQVARCLDDLAAVAVARCDLEEGLSCYERALTQSRGLGKDHEAVSLSGMAEVYSALGDLAKSTELDERAVALMREVWGRDHREVATALEALADHVTASGDNPRARALYEEVLQIREKVLGADHPALAETLAGLARVAWRSHDDDVAFDAALRAETISRHHVLLTARTLPERQALAYASARPASLDLAMQVVAESSRIQPRRAQRAWDSLIRSRALILDELGARHRAVIGSDDVEARRLFEQVEKQRTLLANLVIRGPDPGQDPEFYPRRLGQVRKDLEDAERALAVTSLPFRKELEGRRAGLPEVMKTLPPSSAIVAFERHTLDHGYVASARCAAGPADGQYLAFVTRRGDPQVTAVPIGSASEIDALVSRWRREVIRPAAVGMGDDPRVLMSCRLAGEALRKRVWDPLAPHVAGVDLVFIVPDGPLSLVNFAALPIGGAQYLVEGGPRIHYLSAERDLVAYASTAPEGHGLLAIGAPDFGQAGGSASVASNDLQPAGATRAAPPTPPAPATSRESVSSGRGADCSDFRLARFKPLPATVLEIAQISDLWSRGEGSDPALPAETVHGDDVIHLEGVDATEPAFRQYAPGRRVLHVATHGFFLGDRCTSALRASRGIAALRPLQDGFVQPPAGENPLRLSGLVLAGANRREDAGSEGADGILTAEEIATLDLSGAEWAVLSACETGVGFVGDGEGVFGLRRAFQVAGARSLIMSLWPVGDESTRSWMRSLYESRFIRRQRTADAVHQATLEQLRRRRANGESTHPFYWAGFVAAGDWR